MYPFVHIQLLITPHYRNVFLLNANVFRIEPRRVTVIIVKLYFGFGLFE